MEDYTLPFLGKSEVTIYLENFNERRTYLKPGIVIVEISLARHPPIQSDNTRAKYCTLIKKTPPEVCPPRVRKQRVKF